MHVLLAFIFTLLCLFTGKVLSVENGFICQCYCSISEYVFENGKLKIDSVKYFADIRAQMLPLPGKEGVGSFSNSQPGLRVLDDGRYSEYRTGTVALWNSDFNLSDLSSVDQPNGQHSMISMLSSFDDVFITVNRISRSSLSINSSPAVMIFKNSNPENDNDEYRQKYCERVCQRPVSPVKQYSYSKTEFVELSYNGNLFNQYPTRDSIYYPDIQKSIRLNSGKGMCSEIASSLTGVKSSWRQVFENIRDAKTEELLLEKLNNMYPVLTRTASSPVAIELSESSRQDYVKSSKSRMISFENSMRNNYNVNIVRFPENIPPVFEQPLSPLFQFRAKLVSRNGVWVASEFYTGSKTRLYDFPNEYLNLLLSDSELRKILDSQSKILEKWADDYWNAGYAETHMVMPAPLESIEPISREEGLDRLEEWIRAKDEQVRQVNGDVAISLLKFSSVRNEVNTGESTETNDPTGGKDMSQGPTHEQFGSKELHIIYYGVLTLNCYTQQIGSEIGNNAISNSVVLNLFPDTLIRRDGNDTFKRIHIPKKIKRWSNINNIFDSNNSINSIIRGSSYSFALQLAKYNPQLYLVIFRDLKSIFSYLDKDLFSRNTCKIPENKHHVETVIETSETLQSTVNKIFYVGSTGDVSFNRIKFTDVNHFNLLLNTMSKCLGVLPPTSRVRVSEHFKDQHSVVSDFVCAIDERDENYLLQLYSRYDIN
ncbi:putative low complexity with signal peptide [Cryptosporidium bovis]|uniref:putative low complexity with signal peptide n=1 Tax=Cryptosporidium bovis TaxID=310047 RepID=UPI003519F9EB|nr:putative low complexity with signal peptide [Cryptosporidium bovis]